MSFFILEWVPSSVAGKNVICLNADGGQEELIADMAEKSSLKVVPFDEIDSQEFVTARLQDALIILKKDFRNWLPYNSKNLRQGCVIVSSDAPADVCNVLLKGSDIACVFGAMSLADVAKLNEKFIIHRRMTENDMKFVQMLSTGLKKNACLVFDFVKNKVFYHGSKESSTPLSKE